MPSSTEKHRKWRLKMETEGRCRNCGVDKEGYDNGNCKKCHEKELAARRQRYARLRKEGKCLACENRPKMEGFATNGMPFTKCQPCIDKKRHKNLTIYYPIQKEWGRKLRSDILEHYGKVCVCCGEDIQMFLEIDHKNGGGGKHRRSLRKTGGQTFYVWLRKSGYPDGFQTLCRNCNYGKYRNGGTCPHESSKKTDDVE